MIKNLPISFEDESPPVPPEAVRTMSYFRSVDRGWTMVERFDDRFDTSVGGAMHLVAQTLEDFQTPGGGASLQDILNAPTQRNVPMIIDWSAEHPRSVTAEEAGSDPVFGAVLVRLRERIREHAEHCLKVGIEI